MIAALILLGGSAEGAPPAAVGVDPTVLAGFDALAEEISRVPNGTFTKGQRIALLAAVRVAEAAYRHHLPCVAAYTLGAYLHQTQALRGGDRRGVAEGLYNQGRQLRDDIAAAVPSTSLCHDPRSGPGDPVIHVRASDNQRFAAAVSFGAPRLLTAGQASPASPSL